LFHHLFENFNEIKNPLYAHGLDEIIRKNAFKLSGILNAA